MTVKRSTAVMMAAQLARLGTAQYNTVKDSIILAYDVEFEMNIYRLDDATVRIQVHMPEKYYLAISFGGLHFNSDVIIFYSDPDYESIQGGKLDGYLEPIIDPDYDIYNRDIQE